MIKFLIRRFIFLIVTLFVVSIAVFAISELAPGNIARNVLGNTITPAQEASFNQQHGLDDTAVVRYLRWMLGSDWQAASRVGHPVRQIEDDRGRASWWVVPEEASVLPYRNFSPDGETMYKLERQPDGSTREVPLGDEVWQENEQGEMVYWGVDREGRAAKWVRGAGEEEQTLTKAGWTSVPGAPSDYIPLQKGLLRGDPGMSTYARRPVAEVLFPRLVNTLYLAGIAFLFIMPLSLLFGVIAGLNEGNWIDRLLSVTSLVATATPEFASGVFLIVVFSAWLGWLPGAVVLPGDTSIFERPQMLILPIATLMLVELGYVMRVTRASMVEVMRANYIRTAVLKGLPFWRIVWKHALRNALMAPITVIMLHVNWLVGGIVVVETLYGFPGLGRYILEAGLNKDVFAIEAAAMVMVIIAVTTQMIADMIYVYLNPRIRFA
ncbi:MAG: ABC transporter permease [Chloroflexaceae bacterium]|nr:ABC transporter permease [Chloroflexaceae bacterium]